MKNENIELEAVLKRFVELVTTEIPAGKTYKTKNTDIRVKWLDRGTQKAIKVYSGTFKLMSYPDYQNARQEGGVSDEDE